jgi:ATP-dependent Clp protease adaptor protein ClpS
VAQAYGHVPCVRRSPMVDHLNASRDPSSIPPRAGAREARRRSCGPPRRGTLGGVTQTLDDTRVGTETDPRLLVAPDRPWVTLVWDDPVNLMSYVSYVFRSYFGYSAPESERLMMQVHTTGRAVVATGPREEMERHVEAMHDFGLWATVSKADE